MPSSFYGLQIAKTGLFVSRKALDVTGHNIANANTTGYTRQRLTVEALDPFRLGGRIKPLTKAEVGGGVEALGVDQIRNAFLDREYRKENSTLGYWETKAEELQFVETILNETTDDSISKAVADFFNSLHELSKDPVNKEIRTIVQQNGVKLTESINHTYNQLVGLQKLYNDSMEAVVVDINDHLTNIASYNQQIYAYELGDEKANDLRDQRNVLLDELSELVNIEYSDNSSGQFVLTIEGVTMVDHTTPTLLDIEADQIGVVSGELGFNRIFYEGTDVPPNPGDPFLYSGGKLQAYTDLRDGNSADNVGMPHMLEQLNTLARSLTKEFNEVHTAGFTMPDVNLSTDGVNFFNVPAGGLTDVTAGNFRLSDDILDNVFNIAASDTLIDLTLGNPQQGNNINALAMIELTQRIDLDDVSNFENYLKSFVVNVAIESAHTNKMQSSQSVVLDNIENRRQSISGVSIDEEMTLMIKYQHSYSAASRMINTVDEALDILINRTGMVGR